MASLWRALPARLKTLARATTGPIGLDLATEKIHLVQMARVDGQVVFRCGISRPYPCPRDELLADAPLFRDFVRDALGARSFVGRRVVACLPPSLVQIHPLEYQLASGQGEQEALLRELRERFRETLPTSVIDYVPIRTDAVGPGLRSALVAVAPKAQVTGFLRSLESCGLEPDAIDIGPAALARLLRALDPEAKQGNVLLINFGRARTYLTAVWGRRLILDRGIDFAEDTLVGTLVRNLGLTAAAAGALLQRHGFGSGGDEMAATIAELLRPDFAALAQEVNRTLIYLASRTHGASVQAIYLLGSVARYPGTAGSLQPLFSAPVRGLDVLRVFRLPEGADPREFDPVAGIAVATGLALRGVPNHG